MKALLTTSMLINAKSSPGKSKEELVDTYSKDSLGLYCIIKPENNERIPFRLRMKVDGKTKHFPVGYFPDESLEDLRSKAAELRAQILVGHIPVKTGAVSKQQDMNLTTFMEQHYLPFKKDRKRSYVDDQQIWNLRVKPTDLANKKLSAVTRADVEALQSQAIANGKAPATANHIVKLMRHAMNLAVDWGYLDKNPLSGIKMIFEDNMVENYLDDAQLKRLFDVLESMDTVPSKIVGLLATSGLRLNECLSLKWSSVDINNRLLRVDASNSKSRKTRSVPLTDRSIKIIESLDTKGKYDYLFINKRTNKRYVTIQKSWVAIKKAARLNCRLHDLRHSWASLLVNSGRTLYEVQQILGHSDPKVTMRYAHLSTKALQDAANSANDMINKAVNGK